MRRGVPGTDEPPAGADHARPDDDRDDAERAAAEPAPSTTPVPEPGAGTIASP
jgi:hypothetical protein